jgi:hypothetical protein
MKGGEGTVFYDVPYWRFSGCARINGVGTERRSRSVRCNILAGDMQCVKVNAARRLSTRSQISRASISKNPRPEAWAMLGTALPTSRTVATPTSSILKVQFVKTMKLSRFAPRGILHTALMTIEAYQLVLFEYMLPCTAPVTIDRVHMACIS